MDALLLCAQAAMNQIGRIYHITNGEPPLTRYAVRMLALDSTLDISAARRDLGYAPRVSLAEGIQRLAEWWRAGQP